MSDENADDFEEFLGERALALMAEAHEHEKRRDGQPSWTFMIHRQWLKLVLENPKYRGTMKIVDVYDVTLVRSLSRRLIRLQHDRSNPAFFRTRNAIQASRPKHLSLSISCPEEQDHCTIRSPAFPKPIYQSNLALAYSRLAHRPQHRDHRPFLR